MHACWDSYAQSVANLSPTEFLNKMMATCLVVHAMYEDLWKRTRYVLFNRRLLKEIIEIVLCIYVSGPVPINKMQTYICTKNAQYADMNEKSIFRFLVFEL